MQTLNEHGLAMQYVNEKIAEGGFEPFKFLRPLWQIAGPPPVKELCERLIVRKYNAGEFERKRAAMLELQGIASSSSQIGLAFDYNYSCWRHENLRIEWPGYGICTHMITDPDYAVLIALSGIFKENGWITQDEDGNYYLKAGNFSSSRIIYPIPNDEPMHQWLKTTFTYNKFALELTACIIRAVATTYKDVAKNIRLQGTVHAAGVLPRAYQLCNTLHAAWKYKHGRAIPNDRTATTNVLLNTKSSAVRELAWNDEKLLCQALDQCMMIDSDERRAVETPTFEYFKD